MKVIREEILTPNLQYQLLESDIHRFCLGDVSSMTLDAFAESIMDIDKSYAENQQHACTLTILQRPSFTPYLVTTALNLVQNTPPKLVESAAIVADNILLRILKATIIPLIPDKAQQSAGLFITETTALKWLLYRQAIMRNTRSH